MHTHAIWVLHSRNIATTFFMCVALVYAFALMMSMFNEFFDGSQPQFEQATVIEKSTRFTPMPVAVVSLKSLSGNPYPIDVLDKFSKKIKLGDVIDVVKSEGFLGKPWVQDKELYLFLHSTRTIQGFLYVGVALLLSILWYVNTKLALANCKMAALSLFTAYAIAYGIFWMLP